MNLFEAIDAAMLAHLRGGAAEWWARSTRGPVDRIAFLAAFSGAGRRIGRSVVGDEELVDVRLPEPGLVVNGRPWAELGRVGLAMSLQGRVDSSQTMPLVAEAYRTGDLQEKQATLRALAFLPDPSGLVDTAAEGARSNALAVFEAIGCENPYPSLHFSTDTFNQMTMKALFNDVPLSRIVGFEGRMNADLVRMARDYARERRAAGRTISHDLAMLEQEGSAS